MPAERFYEAHASDADWVHQILPQEDDETSTLSRTETNNEPQTIWHIRLDHHLQFIQ